MTLDSLNLCIAYTRGVKKSVGRVVKTGVVNFSDKARDDKGENDAQHGEGEGGSGTPVAVCLRQDIARADIEQKASKEAQVVRQSNGGNPEEQSGDGTSHRCCCLLMQQHEGATRGVLIDDHQCDGVEAVGEVM